MDNQQQRIVQFFKHIAGQKFTWFALLMTSLTITAFTTRPNEEANSAEDNFPTSAQTTTTDEVVIYSSSEENALPQIEKISVVEMTTPEAKPETTIPPSKNKEFNTSRLIAYAQSLLGTPYIYGGESTDGFDCSGFVYHVFSRFGLELNRSSSTQSTQGEMVAVEAVEQGDLLFFTGTDPQDRTVGHVGIVISEPGEPVTFVHSSSNGGVKISDLEGYYTTRFMFAKRMN